MLFALALLTAHPAPAEPVAPRPVRVLSMNLCTDQLALMLAAPGQLISVTTLAQDPLTSAMPEAALALPGNHGLAEEIFLMRPDLVLAGSHTRPATVALLRRLGIRVELFAPPASLAEVRQAILDTGRALGREAEAAEMASDFDARLADLGAALALGIAAPDPDGAGPDLSAGDGAMAGSPRTTDTEPRPDQTRSGGPSPDASSAAPAHPDPAAARPRAALYYANGYTTGERTLSGDILTAAGFANLASGFGLDWGGVLALERLVLAQPDALILGQRYPGQSRSEELLDHPALAALRARAAHATAADPDWLCGTPHVLKAVAAMVALRQKVQ